MKIVLASTIVMHAPDTPGSPYGISGRLVNVMISRGCANSPEKCTRNGELNVCLYCIKSNVLFIFNFVVSWRLPCKCLPII